MNELIIFLIEEMFLISPYLPSLFPLPLPSV